MPLGPTQALSRKPPTLLVYAVNWLTQTGQILIAECLGVALLRQIQSTSQQQPGPPPSNEDLPIWVRREKERELQAGKAEVPWPLYLVGSVLVAIASVSGVKLARPADSRQSRAVATDSWQYLCFFCPGPACSALGSLFSTVCCGSSLLRCPMHADAACSLGTLLIMEPHHCMHVPVCCRLGQFLSTWMAMRSLVWLLQTAPCGHPSWASLLSQASLWQVGLAVVTQALKPSCRHSNCRGFG